MSGAATSCLTPMIPISTLLPLCLILTYSFLYKYFTWVLGPPSQQLLALYLLLIFISEIKTWLSPGPCHFSLLEATPCSSTWGSLGSQCHFQTIIHMPLILRRSWLLPSPPCWHSTRNHVSQFLKNSTLSHGNFWHLNSLSLSFILYYL